MFDFKPPAWTERASCAEIGGDIFWPEKGDRPTTHRALAICRSCDVRAECLDYAISNGETEGVWGGVLPSHLRSMGRVA